MKIFAVLFVFLVVCFFCFQLTENRKSHEYRKEKNEALKLLSEEKDKATAEKKRVDKIEQTLLVLVPERKDDIEKLFRPPQDEEDKKEEKEAEPKG